MTTWTVPARIVRVIDGDTLDVELDLGWKITYRAKVRLARVNAPEIDKGSAGHLASVFTENSLYDAALAGGPGDFYPITVVSRSLDKYGRVLGDVKWTDRAGVQHDLADDLLAAGHARPA